MQRNETYDLPPPALSGSGSKGTSQPKMAPLSYGDNVEVILYYYVKFKFFRAVRTAPVSYIISARQAKI